jgi:hypothetical protein
MLTTAVDAFDRCLAVRKPATRNAHESGYGAATRGLPEWRHNLQAGKNITAIVNQPENRHFVGHCGRAFLYEIRCCGAIERRGHDDIHQLHSDQYLDVRIEPAPAKGNDLASVDGHYTETHNYRSACARTGLAASRRSSLVVQEIYQGGSGLASLASRARLSEVWLYGCRHS